MKTILAPLRMHISNIAILLFILCQINCSKTKNLTEPEIPDTALKVVASITNASSSETADGAIKLTIFGGKPPFSILWSNGATTKDIIRCLPGIYKVSITDSDGTIFTKSYPVNIKPNVSSPLKILIIGNSLSGRMADILTKLAENTGKYIELTKFIWTGYPFRTYYTHPEFTSILSAQSWDYVFLQSDDLVAFEEYREKELEALTYVKNIVLENNPKTKILYFMCWTMLDGYLYFNYEELYQHIYNEMQFISKEYNFGIVPVGMAWYNTTNDTRRLALYASDSWHPTITGSYLYACVMYAAIFRESIENATFYANISESDARYFQQLATSTVLDNIELWNLY